MLAAQPPVAAMVRAKPAAKKATRELALVKWSMDRTCPVFACQFDSDCPADYFCDPGAAARVQTRSAIPPISLAGMGKALPGQVAWRTIRRASPGVGSVAHSPSAASCRRSRPTTATASVACRIRIAPASAHWPGATPRLGPPSPASCRRSVRLASHPRAAWHPVLLGLRESRRLRSNVQDQHRKHGHQWRHRVWHRNDRHLDRLRG
jgi:hypothetical protein